MIELTEPKTGRSIAVRFKSITCKQHHDSKGRFTSRLAYYVELEAIRRSDQKLLDGILEEGGTGPFFQIGVIEK